MNHSNLSVYLNDHLAGSVAGLELLDHLCEILKKSSLGPKIRAVRAEVAEDREALEKMIERLEITRSPVRKAAGWVSEKAAELKLYVDDPGDGPLRIFESLEAMSLGIEGKRSMWAALSAIADNDSRIDVNECEQIVGRSEHQRRAVETMRLHLVREAFVHTDD